MIYAFSLFKSLLFPPKQIHKINIFLQLSFKLNSCKALHKNYSTPISFIYKMRDFGITMDDIQKSANDKKCYKVITLENGLTALIISDVVDPCDREDDVDCAMVSDVSEYETEESDTGEEDTVTSEDENEIDNRHKNSDKKEKTNLAAVALCIGVGSFSDPVDLPGLAHFLEHMVFMGSEKYPEENYSDAFISKHGGSSNASTDCERTIFQMQLPPTHFKKALDIFAQCFASPLLKVESMEREIEAVDSEFQLCSPKDDNRRQLLFGNLAKEGHPMKNFMWGNSKTLKETPSLKNIDVNACLKKFYKRYYSAHYMTLAVQSTETLETLESWVREIFSALPNNGLPLETFGSLTDPFKTEKFNKLYKVLPVKNYHEVVISWALPPQRENYRIKPLYYLGSLVGHEGKGSILALLKKRSWAVSLMAGNDCTGFDENSTYSLFNISIVLTESGIDNIFEVLTLVFQYLEMLRREGPQERVYNELQEVKANGFRFKEESDSLEYVEILAENMQLFPPVHYLSGNELYFEYNEKVIKDCQDALTVDSANIMILSSRYSKEGNCTEVELWTQCNYCCNDIPNEWIEKWKNMNVNALLHLPEPNRFIASDFDLKHQGEPVNKYPVKIFEDKQSCIWYKEDVEFKVPKAYMYFHFISPVCHSSAINASMMDLLTTLIHHTLSEVAYPAEVANLSYYIYNSVSGFIIQVNGFNHKLPLLLEAIIDHIAKYDVDENMFQSIKHYLSESYFNSFIKPEKLIGELRRSIVQKTFWSTVEKRIVLQCITREMLKNFIQQCFSTVFIEGLIQGNITKEEALLMDKLVKDILKPSPLSRNEFPERLVMAIPEGTTLCRVTSFNIKDQNSVIANYYQTGPGTIKTFCMLELFVAKMSEPCFDTLRTQEQLGYDVSCIEKSIFGILGFFIKIHSPSNKFSCSHVDDRIEEFFKKCYAEMQDLCKEKYKTQLNSMIELKECKDLHLREEVDRNWGEILSREYVFDRLNKEIECLKNLSLEEFKSWTINQILTDSSRRKKLGLQVVGPGEKRLEETGYTHSSTTNYGAEINEINTVDEKENCGRVYNLEHNYDSQETNKVTFITDIHKFKSNITSYPLCKLLS